VSDWRGLTDWPEWAQAVVVYSILGLVGGGLLALALWLARGCA